MTQGDYRILYEKFLRGTCSESEIEMLMFYFSKQKDPQFLKDVELLLQEEHGDITLSPEKSEIIFSNILDSSSSSAAKSPKSKGFYLPLYVKYFVAASLILAAIFSIRKNEGYTETVRLVFQNEGHTVKKVVLQDGTSVYLKPNSKIIQTSNFDIDSLRLVQLVGEAFFAIAKNDNKPFFVHTKNDFFVKVWGTRFNLKSTDEEQEVVLTEGRVSLNHKETELFLKPEERVLYRTDNNYFEKTIVDTLTYVSWINRQLYFLDAELIEVVDQLNKNYAYETQKLRVKGLTSNLQFTGYLPIDNWNKCIEILSKTFANHDIIIEKE